MRTGPDGDIWATREYQPTNRRETNITRRRRFTSCPLSVVDHFDEKFEEPPLLPVDNSSAISTLRMSYRRTVTHANPKLYE
jgi:hypothetical protein